MPTYEFRCHRDGTRYETVASFNEIDTLKPMCETCGKPMGRIFNPAGVILKGSGFYKTDNRKRTERADGSS